MLWCIYVWYVCGYCSTGTVQSGVADPDPGSVAFLTPDPGFETGFSGSFIMHIFDSSVTNFGVKNAIIFSELAHIFFRYPFKNKIIFNL